MMLWYPVLYLGTASASGLHGWGKLSTVIPTVGLAIIYAVALWEPYRYYAIPTGIVIAFFWRFMLRNGNQAHAELQAMDSWNNKQADKEAIKRVWASYYYLPTAALLGWVIRNYLTYDHLNPFEYQNRFWGIRRRIEVLSGLIVQSPVVLLLYFIVKEIVNVR